MSETKRGIILEEARRWWGVAKEDLRVAKACLALDPPSSGNAAYHCQQAAEKTMKGLLVAAGIGFRKIHDLDELAAAATPHFPELASDLDLCRPFSAWATEYRYPPEDEAPTPSDEAIGQAIALVQRLLDRTRTLT